MRWCGPNPGTCPVGRCRRSRWTGWTCRRFRSPRLTSCCGLIRWGGQPLAAAVDPAAACVAAAHWLAAAVVAAGNTPPGVFAEADDVQAVSVQVPSLVVQQLVGVDIPRTRRGIHHADPYFLGPFVYHEQRRGLAFSSTASIGSPPLAPHVHAPAPASTPPRRPRLRCQASTRWLVHTRGCGRRGTGSLDEPGRVVEQQPVADRGVERRVEGGADALKPSRTSR